MRTIRRWLLCLGFLVFSGIFVGCVSKSDYEAVQAELGDCQENRVRAEAQVISWERRFDVESERWNQMEASISDTVPKALSEFHDEGQRIVEMVPQQVQGEVRKYLDDYFATVMTGFEHVMKDSQQIKLQLDATTKVLESLGKDTATIRADTGSISTAIDSALAEEKEKREEVSTELAAVVAQIVEFDQTQINCKSCSDRLKLNRHERESITAFHAALLARLAEIQSSAER